MEAGKTEHAVTTGVKQSREVTTTTTTTASTAPEVLALVAALVVFAFAFWLRARALQREFKRDVVRLD